MAHICNVLQVRKSARNTCLALHIFIGLLYNKIVSLKNLLEHKIFVKNLLSSNFQREDTKTIRAIIRKYKLQDQVCIRRIICLGGKFPLNNDPFGNIEKKTVYLVHRNSHFFLALQLSKFSTCIAGLDT